MSAIGSYAVLTRADATACVALANAVRTETTGRWLFKRSQVVGREAFHQAWRAAVVREVGFDHSGYVLGDYVDAQEAINGIRLVDEEAEPSRALGNVFTSAFVFPAAVALPELPAERLEAFCREEYGPDDAPGMVEAITAADGFYRRGFGEITPEHLVAFVIA